MTRALVLTRNAWRSKINEAWKDLTTTAVEKIIKVGKLLHQAKNQLEHGQWSRLVETDLSFSRMTAHRFMAIAADPRIVTHVLQMPPSWGTLYELTRLENSDFNQMLRAGKINPDMERGDINAFKMENIRAAHRRRARDAGGSFSDLQALIRTGKKFGVIYADPPWEFDAGESCTRNVGRHYSTMPLDEIKALPIWELAADNCVLLTWATWPRIKSAFEVIEIWGFEYKTCGFDYVKTEGDSNELFMGMGYWTRSNAEPCLLATMGKPKRIFADVRQIIMAPVGEHSEKPDKAYERIERLVDGPYLELFARKPRQGWWTWGNEIATVMSEAAE